MNVPQLVISVHEAADPDAAFDAVVENLRALPLRCALRVEQGGVVARCHPDGAEVSSELLDAALHVLRTDILPLGSQFPRDAAQFHDSEMLLLPLREPDGRSLGLALIADHGAWGDDPAAWDGLRRALERVHKRHAEARRLAEQIEALRGRAEESEALHSLGLAANRTLDLEEVLDLVVRFTRTMLGAHFALVYTRREQAGAPLEPVSAVGLAGGGAEPDEPFALAVVDAARPLVASAARDADTPLAGLESLATEGMRVGLGIPLSLYGSTFGALVVGYRREAHVSPRDIRLAVSLAGHAAVAIHNARLHAKVAEHSAELSRAYEELEVATRAKEAFYNRVSHDLRAPISAIRGYHDLLLSGLGGDLPEKAASFLESSRRASQSMLSLVNDLMDFAKLQAGRIDVDLADHRLEEILDDVMAVVEPLASEKGLELRLPRRDTLPVVHTDARRVCQILVNLSSNAVKFTREGWIALEVDDGAADHVAIHVRDTGAGIAEDQVERVFDEFAQVKGSVGTGLGLPIARSLAERLGGSLTLESRLGEGSTFTLRLPRGEADGARADERADRRRGSESGADRRQDDAQDHAGADARRAHERV